MTLCSDAGYPEGNFGRNHLSDGSIGLSPLRSGRRSICTSEPLRPSTGLLSGFSLPMCSSPSFGCLCLRSGRGLQESQPVLVRDCFRFAFSFSGAPQTRDGHSAARPPHTLRQGARQHVHPYADVLLPRDRVLLADGQRSNLPLRLALTLNGFAFSLTLFRVLFNCPLQYFFALGLAVGVEPRVKRTTLFRAAISSNPTLEPKISTAIRFYSHPCDGPDARSGHGPCRGVSDVLL